MSRLVRSLLCLILLAMAFIGPPISAAAQGEVPPPPPSSETDIREDADTSMTGAVVLPGPSEAEGVQPGIASDEAESMNAFRLEHPTLTLAAAEYYSVAGSVFQPRNSVVKSVYASSGCIYRSGNGGSDDNNSFTAPVNLPNGAVILGVRLFGYDSTTSDMRLNFFQFAGTGNFTNALSINPTGTPGYFSTYVTFDNPITVNQTTSATSLIWYPFEASINLRLCGARILYYPPFPPVFSAAGNGDEAHQSQENTGIPQLTGWRSFATFIAGQDFHPRTSTSRYSYGGGGCVTASTNDYFVSDADLPEGARLWGAKLFYYDASAINQINFYVTTYNGTGGGVDLVASTNQNTAAGYGVMPVTLPTTHTVSQFTQSMVVQALVPSDPQVKFCGMQLLWYKRIGYVTSGSAADPSEETESGLTGAMDTSLDVQRNLGLEYQYRFIAGSAFQPRDGNTSHDYVPGGCIYATKGSILTADLQLPPGANLYGVRFYTYDTSIIDSSFFLSQYDMQSAFADILTGSSSGRGGYNSVYVEKVPNHTVDTMKSYTLVWNAAGVIGQTMQLCGMRVFYSFDNRTSGVFLPLLRR